MSPASERAATFASGLGRRFSIHDLAAMTEMSVTELIDPVNLLVQADIFADDGGQLAFRHDILREAVRGSLLPPIRRAVDRQAAEVLLARGALPVERRTGRWHRDRDGAQGNSGSGRFRSGSGS
jgi:hypothetical protein